MDFFRRSLFFSLFSFTALQVQAYTTMQYVPGNPRCSDFGYSMETKLSSYNGTFNLAGLSGKTVSISSSDNKFFSWYSNAYISAVIAKGGDGAYLYTYSPAAQGDTGLRAPNNNGGQIPTLSHVDFCYGNQPPSSTTTTRMTTTTTRINPTTTTQINPTTTTQINPTTTTRINPTTTTRIPSTTTTLVGACRPGWKELYLPGWKIKAVENTSTYWSLINENNYVVPVMITYYDEFGNILQQRTESLNPFAMKKENIASRGIVAEYGYVRFQSCGPLVGDFSIEGDDENQCPVGGFADSESLVKLTYGKHRSRFKNDPAHFQSTEVIILRPEMYPEESHVFNGYTEQGGILGQATVPGAPLTHFDFANLVDGSGSDFNIRNKTDGWMSLDCGKKACIVCSVFKSTDRSSSKRYCW